MAAADHAADRTGTAGQAGERQSTAALHRLLGKPIEDKKQLTEKLSDALDALLHRSADTTEK